MTDINSIGKVASGQGLPSIKPAGRETGAAGFEDMMQEAMGKLSQVQKDAESAVKELASGGDPTQAIIAMEKADMNFQMMVEVRNKLISAYQEIMRMQV
jgi:flagellar hook-basal body complex protein FliE